jgi:8-oxo-dGTP diphosphatase
VINPLAVLYCCKYGIALFDEPEEGQNFSPNVAYELGIMHYQHKSCCILINESIEKKKPFDIIGKIHYQYKDNLKIQDHIEDWLRKNHVKIIQPHKQIDQIAVAIIKRGKKFLITKRKIKEGNLEWSFPAKKIKPGYNETTALVKECIAETNVEIQTINLLGERDIANNGNSMKIRYWLCKYIKGSAEVKDQDELEQVKWVTGQQAIKLISTDIFQPLKKILRGK